jgi:molecular chaperone GrpE
MEQKETLEEEIIFTKSEVEAIKSEMNDKYLRLYADFDNYKKRAVKEKEDIKTKTKIDTITSILDLDNDLSIATKNDPSEGLKLIVSKVDNYLKSQGISTIPCDEYDIDTHEVISKISDGEDIIDVASKGYKFNDIIIRYPKVILGKK